MNVAENIKKYRKVRKINQTELGELINKSLRSVMKYEQGDVVPSLAVLEDIATALNVDMFLLIRDKVIPTQKISEMTVSVGLEGMEDIKTQLNELSAQLDLILKKYELIKEYSNENNTPV